MDERELCYMPAVTALEQFREAKLSPLELLNALIARDQKVEPSINAFTDRYFEEALEKAAAAEERYAVGSARPLHGRGWPLHASSLARVPAAAGGSSRAAPLPFSCPGWDFSRLLVAVVEFVPDLQRPDTEGVHSLQGQILR